MLSLTGFYEFFENELVSQSPGPGLPNFTFNAPASEHRGIEAAADIALGAAARFTAAYIFNNQIYTDYTEQLPNNAPPPILPGRRHGWRRWPFHRDRGFRFGLGFWLLGRFGLGDLFRCLLNGNVCSFIAFAKPASSARVPS